MKCVDDNFLMTDKLSRCSVEPVFINNQESVGFQKVERNVSCNDHYFVEFKIMSQVSKINYKNYNPGLQESTSWFVQGSAWQDPWDTAMKFSKAKSKILYMHPGDPRHK